tara:strand:- start:1516 stop:2079 length:564 start_codon:yes stop_codon:yes gene_type:complete
MAIIYSYPQLASVEDRDLLLISDLSSKKNPTMRVELGTLATHIKNSIDVGVTSVIAGAGISIDQPTGDVTITATGSPATLPYRSYVCLLNQSGTNPPVPTILENSLAIPDTPNPWQRQQAGIYNLIASGIVPTFPVNKTIVFLNNGLSPTISNNIRWERVSDSEVEIVVSTGDNYLVNASLEVRVYD